VPYTVTRTVTVTVQKTTPSITTGSLEPAAAGTAYDAQLAVADGRPGTWSVAEGSLPAGLTVTRAGLLTGMPTATDGETATFTVRFTDAWNTPATRSYTLTVTPAGF
jgi:hypothetical protein